MSVNLWMHSLMWQDLDSWDILLETLATWQDWRFHIENKCDGSWCVFEVSKLFHASLVVSSWPQIDSYCLCMDETLQANGLPPVIDSQTHNCVKVRVSFQNHNIKFHFTKNFNQIFFECRMKQQLHGEATALLVFFFARWIQRLANHTRLWLQPHPLPRVFSHFFSTS